MKNEDEIRYLLALKRYSGLGDIMIRRLLQALGSATNIWNAPLREIEAVEGIGKLKRGFYKNENLLQEADEQIELCLKDGTEICTIYDAHYPQRLKLCADSPLIFFKKGKMNLNVAYTLSIVGTRQISTYGAGFLREFIPEIKKYNPLIVSGYAYGVDILAHELAIENGLQTVAVMAHGLNLTYPSNHRVYNDAMMKNGGFVTDFWHTQSFDRKNFLGRNRIIAGLTEATLVVESASKGGSLVTAELANDYGREVFAVPGRITDKYSSGCNDLIKQARAHLMTTHKDLEYILNWTSEVKSVQKSLFVELTTDEKTVYNYLKSHGKELLDIIAIKTGQPVHLIATTLMTLELKGVVRPLPGKMFELA